MERSKAQWNEKSTNFIKQIEQLYSASSKIPQSFLLRDDIKW